MGLSKEGNDIAILSDIWGERRITWVTWPLNVAGGKNQGINRLPKWTSRIDGTHFDSMQASTGFKPAQRPRSILLAKNGKQSDSCRQPRDTLLISKVRPLA